MHRLLDQPRVKEELASFRERIGNVKSESLKQECGSLLTQLVGEIKNLDMYHDQLFVNPQKKLSGMSNDSRENVSILRRKLESKLKDIKRAKL